MKRLFASLVLVAVTFLASVLPAQAAIHPIVASFCAAVASSNEHVLDPPGQTPTSNDPNTWTMSNLRALIATGVLHVTRDANGNITGFTFDPNHPAVKDFGFPAFVNCKNLNP